MTPKPEVSPGGVHPRTDREADVRERWEAINREAEEEDGFERVEHYPAGAEADLALRLHREGLLFRINREILHPLGLALGIDAPTRSIDRDLVLASEATGLHLSFTGGEPIEYTPEQIERAERKHGRSAG